MERFTLGNETSAHTFNDYWSDNIKSGIKESAVLQPKLSASFDADLLAEEVFHLFDFEHISVKHEDVLIEALSGLLPEAQGENYEEQDFVNMMRRERTIRQTNRFP